MSKYPEHDKLENIKGESQTIGEFVEEFLGGKGVRLCTLEFHYSGAEASHLQPTGPIEATQAASEAVYERNARRARGQACPRCDDAGIELTDAGAVICDHRPVGLPEIAAPLTVAGRRLQGDQVVVLSESGTTGKEESVDVCRLRT